MKKRWLQTAIVNVFFLMLVVLVQNEKLDTSELKMVICYEEYETSGQAGEAVSQLFWSTEQGMFHENDSVRSFVIEANSMATFTFPEMDFQKAYLRLDPFMSDETFSIKSIWLYQKGALFAIMSGDDFHSYISQMENCECITDEEGTYIYIPTSDDPVLYLDISFNEAVIALFDEYTRPEDNKTSNNRFILVFAALLIGMESGSFLFSKSGRTHGRAAYGRGRKVRHICAIAAADLLVCFGLALSYGVWYLLTYFGDVRLEELLFLLDTPLEGSNLSPFYTIFAAIAVGVTGITLVVFATDFFLKKHQRNAYYAVWLTLVGAMAAALALGIGANHIDVATYFSYITQETQIYDEYYVDGRTVELTFPEQKRNLIYIYLESMEITYADQESGGAMEENYIPNLTRLAQENINFSGTDALNGGHALTGGTFTAGAIIAQTSGISLNTIITDGSRVNEWEYGDSYLFPGAWTLGDILNEQGYAQVFMIGSDGNYGGRGPYFQGHGNYTVMDYYTAVDEGKISEDYYVWWGYEDEKLIEYAKEEILQLASAAEPFNFTMLTVDTHFTDGYLCELCGDEYALQYSNVIACSDSQISELVTWIMEQDFYEDTTIIISGDHLTMDSAYITRTGADSFNRRTYFTIINPAGSAGEGKEREYSTLDIYPTTLAALGVQIEGDRLGLGVNLFSDVPTLYEEYGADYLNAELMKYSTYYVEELLD